MILFFARLNVVRLVFISCIFTGSGAINDRGYSLNSHPNITGAPHNDEYDFDTASTVKVPGDRVCPIVAKVFFSDETTWAA